MPLFGSGCVAVGPVTRLFVSGACAGCFAAVQATIVMACAPPDLRSRVLGAPWVECIKSGCHKVSKHVFPEKNEGEA